MAAIDFAGRAERAGRERKSLHPSCYLLAGLGVLIAAALLLDVAVRLIG